MSWNSKGIYWSYFEEFLNCNKIYFAIDTQIILTLLLKYSRMYNEKFGISLEIVTDWFQIKVNAYTDWH